MSLDHSIILWAFISLVPQMAYSQQANINQDESLVPAYQLPNSLVCTDGTVIDSANEWTTKRRPELMKQFADHVYGNLPTELPEVEFQPMKPDWEILDGTAIRRQIEMVFRKGQRQIRVTLLLTLPKSSRPVPCFVGLNFHGNHTTTEDTRVALTSSWVRNDKKSGATDNQASADGRGSSASRWPYAEIVGRGYGVCTFYYGDVDPDFDDQFQNGLHSLLVESQHDNRSKQSWGSIATWAWSLSSARRFLESDPAIAADQIAVIGHSRLGKTALWAGATDPQFALVISNDSGCGGAALFRRRFGETVEVINKNFPHWFCDQFLQFNDRESKLPVDQHMLIALIAPRAVYVASATDDQWADPKGEYLSLLHAQSVYSLFRDGTLPPEFPAPDVTVQTQKRGYHVRTGRHDITLADWKNYLNFADQQFKSKSN